MNLIEAAQMALNYLDAPSSKVWAAGTQYKIIQALRAALAQPEREWQGLTDDEITRLRHLYDPTAHWSLVAFAHAIEAKLKEKNS